MTTRRRFLRTAALTGTVSLTAGCLGPSGGTERDENEVIAGPDGDFVFEPAEITIAVGESVTWTFDSPGHNVGARPQDSDRVSLPDGATPFASYEGSKIYQTVEQGGTFEHTFETPGEYVYVCIPHIVSGMVGKIIVSE